VIGSCAVLCGGTTYPTPSGVNTYVCL
jgi:hypothetical protein